MSPHDSLEPHAMLLSSFLCNVCFPLPSNAGIICKLSAPVGFAEFRVEACLFLFLPSSLLEVEEGESKRQLGSCITRTRTQSKATQTDTDTDGGGGEGRGRLLLRKALTFREDRASQLIFVRFKELCKRRLPHRGRKGLVEQAPLY